MLSLFLHSFRQLPVVAFASLLGIVFLASGCNTVGGVDHRGNYAIDAYFVQPNEAQLTENRARIYWQTHAARFGANPPFLAIESGKLLPGEIVQDLWAKIQNSTTTSSAFSTFGKHAPNPQIYSVLIFDIRANRLVSNQGYAVVDRPPRGVVALFGDYVARFIGTGRF
jgi:hypothetical protein